MVKPFEIKESQAMQEGRYHNWYSAPSEYEAVPQYDPQTQSEEIAPQAMQKAMQDEKKEEESNWLGRKLDAITETGLGLSRGITMAPAAVVNSFANAADWLFDTNINPDDRILNKYADFVEAGNPDFQGIEEKAPVANFVTQELVPTVAMGVGFEAVFKGMLAGAAKMDTVRKMYKGSSFWEALQGGATNVSKASAQGIVEGAKQYIAGSIAREVSAAVFSEAMLSPMMYLKKMDGDEKYAMDYGAFGEGTAFSSLLATAFGGIPALWMVRNANRSINYANSAAVRDAAKGNAMMFGPSANANRALQHYNDIISQYPVESVKSDPYIGNMAEEAFTQMQESLQRLFKKDMSRDDVENLYEQWKLHNDSIDILDEIRPLQSVSKARKNANVYTGMLESGAAIKYNFGERVATDKYYNKAARAIKNSLTMDMEGSFITSASLGNFNGSLTQEGMDMLKAVGNTETAPSKIGSFLVGYKNRFMRDPLRKAAAAMGEKTTALFNKAREVLDTKQQWIKAYIARPYEEIRDELNKFWDVYSAQRNNGWDVAGVVSLENGKEAIKLLDTEHNREQWARMLQFQNLRQGGTSSHLTGKNRGKFKTLEEWKKALDESYDAVDASGNITRMPPSPLPEFMPSLRDIYTPATFEAGSDSARLYNEIMNIENEIANGQNHARIINKNLSKYRKYHTRTPQMEGDEIWSAVYGVGDPNIAAADRPYFSFASKKDAEAFARGLGENWQVLNGSSRLKAIGIEKGTLKHRLYETMGEAGGHWQGDFADQGVKGIVEILEGQVRGTHNAINSNVHATNNRIFELIEQANGKEIADELREIVIGNANMYRINKTLDGFLNAIGREVDDVVKWAKRVGVEPDDFRVLPRELPFQTRKALSAITKNLGQFYYGVANLSGAVTNCLSVLQAIPLSTAWFNKSLLETDAEYIARTTITNGEYRGMLDTFRLGSNFMKRAATEEGFWKTLSEEARQAGILGGDYRVVQEALDASSAIKKSSGVMSKVKAGYDKTKEILALPVTKSEEFSRLVTYGMGRQYAEDFLKYSGQQASDFASLFTEIGMGGFSPLSKMGWAQSMLGSHLALFTTYTSNMLFRSLELIADKDLRRFVVGQILSSTLFGVDTNPVNTFWLGGHEMLDDVKMNMLYDNGLAAFTGMSVADRLNVSPADVVGNFQQPPMVSFAGSVIDLVSDAARDIALSGEISGRHLAETLSIHSPIIFAKRLAQAGLGYTVDRNHRIVLDARDDILKQAGFLAGITSTEDAFVKNVKRIQFENEQARDEARKTFRSAMMSRLRGKSDINKILVEAFKLYGYDTDALLAAVFSAASTADRNALTQLEFNAVKSPTPENLKLLQLLFSQLTDSTVDSRSHADNKMQ